MTERTITVDSIGKRLIAADQQTPTHRAPIVDLAKAESLLLIANALEQLAEQGRIPAAEVQTLEAPDLGSYVGLPTGENAPRWVALDVASGEWIDGSASLDRLDGIRLAAALLPGIDAERLAAWVGAEDEDVAAEDDRLAALAAEDAETRATIAGDGLPVVEDATGDDPEQFDVEVPDDEGDDDMDEDFEPRPSAVDVFAEARATKPGKGKKAKG